MTHKMNINNRVVNNNDFIWDKNAITRTGLKLRSN